MAKVIGRKTLVGLLTLGVGVGITVLRGDIPPNLLSLLQVVFGAFVLGNGIEHTSKAVIERLNAPKEVIDAQASTTEEGPNTVDLSEVHEKLDTLSQQSNAVLDSTSILQQGIGAILQIANPQKR